MRSVLTALSTLEAVSMRQPVGVSELARAMDLPKSSVQRALVTLQEAGWIRGDPTAPGKWAVSGKVAAIARRTHAHQLHNAALPVIQRLGLELGETIDLFEPAGDGIVLIGHVVGNSPIRELGSFAHTAPFHATAAGKAVLAHLPSEQISRILGARLERWTRRTITNPRVMRRELATIREQGYAINRGEQLDEIAAIAAPIVVSSGVVAAVSLLIARSRFNGEIVTRYAPPVVAAAGEIAQRLGDDDHL